MDAAKALLVVSEPLTAFIPPLGESNSISPKRIKTLMIDKVSQDDLKNTTLTHDLRSSHQSKPSTEFKLWSNSFDGLRYLYDHLNASE